MSRKSKMKEVVEHLKEIKINGKYINGCIAGSCMLDADFDTWADVPDVDVFVFTPETMIVLAYHLLAVEGYEWNVHSDSWKFDRTIKFGTNFKAPVNTIKLKKDDVIVNISYKKNKKTIADVLASFDMSIIMIGYDLYHHQLLDMRTTSEGSSIDVAIPNPLRDQDVDMYGTEMWVRQFDRVIKYWNRGYDTRPMARFYIDLVNGVVDTGQMFPNSERASAVYQDFLDTYLPIKDKMVQWLQDKED